MTAVARIRAMPILAVATILAACGQNNQYAAPPPPKVTVAAPVEQQVTRYFDATGNTASINSVDLVARVQGFVQAISYKDGDYVKKGTSLFTIEPEPYKLKVDSAKAAVVSAQATLTQNKRSTSARPILSRSRSRPRPITTRRLRRVTPLRPTCNRRKPASSRPRSISAIRM